jgi:two-component SAPR family response regulator
MAAAHTAATPEQVFALYRGPFLNHVEAPWAIAWRERLRARHRSYVLSLGRVLETAGQGQDAIGLYQKSIATDATVEAFHQAQIRCHIQQGQITEARAAYEHCRRVFASLGLALSRETQSLIHPYL